MLKLPAIFSDNAIFQRRKNIPVWGWTSPDTLLECEFNSQKFYTASSMLSGKFTFSLPPMEAGGPYTLLIRNLATKEEVCFQDILIGEVWLASGQSNMEFLLQTSGIQLEEFTEEKRTEEEIDSLRMFTVKKNSLGIMQDDCAGSWENSNNDGIKNWSAVALWFGKKLQNELGVPVGLINSSWGGTIVETWTSKETFLADDKWKNSYLENASCAYTEKAWKDSNVLLNAHVAPVADIQAYFKKTCVMDGGLTEKAAEWMKKDFDDSSWQELRVPGDWIKQGAGEHGAFWYRKTVTIPESWEGNDIYLRMPTIDKQDTMYFNGEKAGSTGKEFEYAGENRKYPVPGRLVKAGKAIIAIRAYSFIYGAGVYGAAEECILENAATKERISISGIWKGCQETTVPVPDNITTSGSSNIVANPNAFTNLFNGMIHPLIPYAIAGIIWYQGESNAGKTVMPGAQFPPSILYREKLGAMIKDWRTRWGEKYLPFIMVGLAGYENVPEYDEESSWARLRESQRKCALDLPATFVASAVDCGEKDDIHPRDKRTVGFRLACQALHHIYNRNDITPCGPMPVKKEQEGNFLRITFDYADGLKSSIPGTVKGFRIAAMDGKFYPADVVIEGKSVVLSSKEVPFPCYVRYGWSNYPICTLVNSADLPAFPFEM